MYMLPIALMLLASVLIKSRKNPAWTIRRIERGATFHISDDGEIAFVDEDQAAASAKSRNNSPK
jgi:hypothetical protein